MMDKLKSCPFCEGAAVKLHNCIKCLRCGVTKMNAEIWNTRPKQVSLEEIKEVTIKWYRQYCNTAKLAPLNKALHKLINKGE